MKLLDEYLTLQKQLFEYFGYVEDWVKIPIDDARAYFWRCDGHTVRFATTEEGLAAQSGDEYYENEVYTQRFLPRWVYEAVEYTMICVDTRTDGNKFLQIFSNDKRRERSPETAE